jgi:integrase
MEGSMLLETFAVDFLAFASGRLKASTLRDYRYCLASHIVPRLGKKHLHQLTTRDVLMLQSQLAPTPARANRAVNITLRMVRVAAQLGHRVGVVERPKAFRERRRERYLTHEEALRLLQVLDREPSLGAVVIRLLLLTGMRRGEALGLKWSEVDAERSMLRLGDSKTGARVVPLSPAAMQLVMSLPRVAPHVFPGRAGHVTTFQKVWERVRHVAELREVRCHDLRHSWASFAVAAGVSLPVIGAVLGHRNPSTTARYTHVSPELALAATREVARRLNA